MNVCARAVTVKAIGVKLFYVLAGLCLVAQARAGTFAQTIPSQSSQPSSAVSTVAVVFSGAGEAYEQAAQALEPALAQALRQEGKATVFVRMNVQEGAAPFKPVQPAPQLYIALGVQACGQLARQNSASLNNAPVLCTLLPRQSFEYLLRETGRQVGSDFSALYLNQPLARQLDLIRLALPRARRVGVLLSAAPGTRQMEEQLAELARERGLRLTSARVDIGDPLFPGLKQVLDESDVLLALADPQIYNSHTIQNILLASFRARVPMQAFSPAYARAGALLALYSTPEQIGTQVAALARDALVEQNGKVRGFGPPQHTQLFEVSVNAHVARSLGLQLDADVLAERLRRLEQKTPPEGKAVQGEKTSERVARTGSWMRAL